MDSPVPATLARAPARPQARAGEEACADTRQDAPAEAEPPPRRPAAFYSSVFAQIEEIGWKQLVSATGDGVSCLTFRVVDEPGRMHLLEITLPMGYPESPPSISADVPYLPKIHWSKNSRLKDVICQFQAVGELFISPKTYGCPIRGLLCCVVLCYWVHTIST
ncbi:zinc ion binding [Zea mays]|uniref:Zinc ion binding n=1 Tax=Zea mays TaxID=4577 RepID=A0A1D6GIE7_MAIZE|nr:zinc ion binding [Zea mays]